MQSFFGLLALALALPALASVNDGAKDAGHHHHHHHRRHRHHGLVHNAGKVAVPKKPEPVVKAAVQADTHVESGIVEKMKKLEARLAEKAKAQAAAASAVMVKGHILVNSPLPADFSERFVQAVALATGTETTQVKVTDTTALEDNSGIVEVAFEASPKVVKAVENDAADPDSKLAQGNLRQFLVAKEEPSSDATTQFVAHRTQEKPEFKVASQDGKATRTAVEVAHEATPVEEKGIDIDTAMPYGDLEPFGREDTAQELTESSVRESDGMVDQLERAEVAEEKRAVFRSLTRLRGAAITSFDGVARSQTGNIDEYNKVHKWRKTHPLHHLADEESDVGKWAFPDNADF
jgi:hypothetical protein